MKIKNIQNLDKFFDIVESCNGKVELITGEGDRLNLKSSLCRYVALAKVFSDGIIPELELVIYDVNDVHKFINFVMYE